jgi:hypothetical protein
MTTNRADLGVRRRSGSALFVAVMMLVLMGFIGLASLDTVTADRQVAGFQTRARLALDAAEAGLATALGGLVGDVDNIHALEGLAALDGYNPPFPGGTTQVGESTSYAYGQPTFSQDPDVANAIDYLGSGSTCEVSVNGDGVPLVASEIGGATWRKSLWEVRVQGTTADAVSLRLQATASVCRPY